MLLRCMGRRTQTGGRRWRTPWVANPLRR
ncbi:hypothetical protein Ahy_A07g034474 isoform B [Arachis hypogaea]|uniref:Uncharacterized protein n=1 Tax=Arachis hypogaea TaxID=3818 RepID=A0A445CBU6_ARAHY|nr:hypothetical protein Ahy_A07g034474 isoform B [Arachis hypogaea]